MNLKLQGGVKAALSLFLIYHLSAVFILPNSTSLVGRRLSRYFSAYANQLNFNTTWQFFSPGPSPMFYLEYSLLTEHEIEGADADVLSYPPARKPFSFDDGYSRRLFGMRFFALSPQRLEQFFIPFLCRQKPGVKEVVLQSVVIELPAIEKADLGGQYEHRFEDLGEKLELPRQYYKCQTADESGATS